MMKWMRETDSGFPEEVGSPEESNRWDGSEWTRMRTALPNGYEVSTVFLGLDHSGGVYETMVFCPNHMLEFDCDRYHDLHAAKAGHEDVVAKWAVKPDYDPATDPYAHD